MAANYWQHIPSISDESVEDIQQEEEAEEEQEAHEDQAEQQFNVGEHDQLPEEEEGDDDHHVDVFRPPENQGVQVGVGWQSDNQMEQVDVGWYPNNLPDNQDEQIGEANDKEEEKEDVYDTNGYCNLCDARFGSSSAVLNHQRQHKESKNICPNCQRKFENKSNLWIHADKRHHRKLRLEGCLKYVN